MSIPFLLTLPWGEETSTPVSPGRSLLSTITTPLRGRVVYPNQFQDTANRKYYLQGTRLLKASQGQSDQPRSSATLSLIGLGDGSLPMVAHPLHRVLTEVWRSRLWNWVNLCLRAACTQVLHFLDSTTLKRASQSAPLQQHTGSDPRGPKHSLLLYPGIVLAVSSLQEAKYAIICTFDSAFPLTGPDSKYWQHQAA